MDIIAEIKKKKELAGLSDVFVKEILDKHLKNPVLKEKEKKIIIKQVRSELRKYVGRFSSPQKRLELLEEGKMKELLETHQSTKERLPYYSEFKKKVYNLEPKSILDIGCGLNPLVLAQKGLTYLASDINESDLKIVSNFFQKNNIEGKTFFLDARKDSFPKADLVLLLKVLDLLETRGHKRAEEIFKALDCKFIIASFSTKTLSGRAMNHPQRGWIERLCNRLNYQFSIWKTQNEIYYFIQKPLRQ